MALIARKFFLALLPMTIAGLIAVYQWSLVPVLKRQIIARTTDSALPFSVHREAFLHSPDQQTVIAKRRKAERQHEILSEALDRIRNKNRSVDGNENKHHKKENEQLVGDSAEELYYDSAVVKLDLIEDDDKRTTTKRTPIRKEYEKQGAERKDGSLRSKLKHRSDGKKKYLIYRCDDALMCSGFADRQRAIAGLYLLSLASNRTFGIIMTNPTDILDFYQPNEVKWNLPKSELEGKSSIDLWCMRGHRDCSLNDINSKYPEDVVYVRTKSTLKPVITGNKLYLDALPSWIHGNEPEIFGNVWLRLMKPTPILRQGVNDILKTIAKDARHDTQVFSRLSSARCQVACGEVFRKRKIFSRAIDECRRSLPTYEKTVSREDGTVYLRHVCPIKFENEAFVTPPSDDVIDEAKEYDQIDMGLVCAQIRVGKSSTIRNEPVFNRIEDLGRVWDLLREYINMGHQAFLATDSEEVRDLVKDLFGPRVHVNSDPIVHVNKVGEDQDAWSGMRFALMEQLFLSTSCRVLIYTGTGFGSRSAFIRHVLMGEKQEVETFMLRSGRLKKTSLKRQKNNLHIRLKS